MLERFFEPDLFIPTLICGAIVSTSVVRRLSQMWTNIARERTRREIAAYIAEGSMTPEQGERLMRAGEKPE